MAPSVGQHHRPPVTATPGSTGLVGFGGLFPAGVDDLGGACLLGRSLPVGGLLIGSLLVGFDSQQTVDLFLRHRTLAGGCRHHEITHKLDLGLQLAICEAVSGVRHMTDSTQQRTGHAEQTAELVPQDLSGLPERR